MSKKLIYLISFVLVLVMTLTSTASAELVAWWKLDETSGTIAFDSSGNGYDGTLNGNPTWAAGKLGGALQFDGSDDYVNCGTGVSFTTVGDGGTAEGYTISVWINPSNPGGDGKIFGDIDDSGWGAAGGFKLALYQTRIESDVRDSSGRFFSREATEPDGLALGANTWYHVAVVYDDAGDTYTEYINGEVSRTVSVTQGVAASTAEFRIGTDTPGLSHYFNGLLDDIRIYDSALSQQEILSVMAGRGPQAERAAEPIPEDEATDVPRDVVLNWMPGEYAPPINGHKVYFGESFNDVNDATGGITQDANSYTLSQRLDFGTTYYWRIDEVNAPPDSTIFKGDVWSFTTEPIAYPIAGENITATASSTHLADTGPENTINGSGLDVNDLHSTLETDMWLSGEEKEPNKAWIEYELDKVHKLHEMWIWNHNGTMEPVIGFGFKDVTIEHSVNGTDYTTLGTTHEFARAPGVAGYAYNTTVDFGGATAKYVRLTANSNWGGILEQYGLSKVRFFSIPVFAREPSPDSGTTDVAVDVTLGFRAGREVAEHNVYLSTDEQTVIDGNAPVTTVTEASYGPLLLDLDTTYYWKINEVNMAETITTWESDIWNFTTHEYFVVDGFEDYNDYPPDEIWFTWVDGYGVSANGATVGYPNPDWNQGEHFVETAIVQGGDQAMPFFYSNTGGATYSEGERTFAVPQDWTKAGIQTLVLYFHGTAGNTGQMYVKINGSKIPYDGAGNIALAGWQVWNIDLASSGLNLQNVSSLVIGIDGSSASGTLYFDDIRLYRSALPPVTEWRITAGSDDAEEDVGGSAAFEIDLGSTDMELMYDNNPADPLDEQVVGLRFVGIAIPKGSTITEAWVQFDADDVDDPEHVGNAYILIDGELNPASVTFENTPNNITGRPRTTAQVSWTSEPWPVDGGSDQKAWTPDISSIIQEIVDQDGWAGSALVLIFSQDPATPSVGHRECDSFNGNASEAPLLHISYQ